MDSKSNGLLCDSHCRSCVEVLGKVLLVYCLYPPESIDYLVESNMFDVHKFPKLIFLHDLFVM